MACFLHYKRPSIGTTKLSWAFCIYLVEHRAPQIEDQTWPNVEVGPMSTTLQKISIPLFIIIILISPLLFDVLVRLGYQP